MLFVSFLKNDKINEYCDQFINTYKINETEEIRETVKNYLIYFISIKELIIETME
jgi:hypothetical protein